MPQAFDSVGRAETERELMRAADAAAVLKVKYFVLHPGPEKSPFPENETLMRLHNAAGVLRRLDQYCGRLGMQLILENMLPHLFAGRTTNLSLMGMCVDTGHAQLGGHLRQIIEFSRPRIRLVHASDNYGRRDDHLPPGDGFVDWPPVLRQLVDIGYSGTLIVDCGFRRPGIDDEGRLQGP